MSRTKVSRIREEGEVRLGRVRTVGRPGNLNTFQDAVSRVRLGNYSLMRISRIGDGTPLAGQDATSADSAFLVN